MEGRRPNREQLVKLARTDPEAIVDLVLALWDRVEALEAKIAAMERNSRTSSKPPSSDKGNFSNPPKPKPKSQRSKSGRKPGGQEGHRGDTLRKSDAPDHVVEHRLEERAVCPSCGAGLEGVCGRSPLVAEACECRQVFELPAIKIEITEHRAEKGFCARCGKFVTAGFPEGVGAPVQYGPGVQAAALYLGGYQLIPFQRLAETFAELFGCPLSQGTLANFIKRGGANASEAMAPVREALVAAPVAHGDETGCTLHGKRHWLHVFSTSSMTCFHIDAKRGSQAMERMGLLARFRGILIHDFLSAYYRFENCRHFLCNAHLLRELTYLHEQMEQPWAADMIELLREAKKLRDRHKALPPGSRRVIGDKTLLGIQMRYCRIVLEGLALNPEPAPPPKAKRGRVKRSKALNLLIRLDDRYEEIMGFFEYDNVPFDNNQAERDLRMMKIREKISGTFRSETHARAFCDIRGIISSVRKQSREMLGSLTTLVQSPKTLGNQLAAANQT